MHVISKIGMCIYILQYHTPLLIICQTYELNDAINYEKYVQSVFLNGLQLSPFSVEGVLWGRDVIKMKAFSKLL